MKVLAILTIVHLLVCATAGYLFRVRVSETHQEFHPAIDMTTDEERARGEAKFLMAQTHIVFRPPTVVLIYGLVGLLALLAAFGYKLYQPFFSRS
jgi:hypothetical protein